MLNISSVSRLAGKALTVLKPTTRKITSTLIFGAGAGVGYLVGQNNSQKVVSSQTTEPVADSTVAKPKQEQGEKEFTYVPPKIGEDGIVKADTSYYAGTKQPKTIFYNDKYNRMLQVTHYDENGKMESISKYEYDDPSSRDYRNLKCFDKNGELNFKSERFYDGSIYYDVKTDDGWAHGHDDNPPKNN